VASRVNRSYLVLELPLDSRPVYLVTPMCVREREFICHKTTKKTYKIILNISTVADYQIGKPIKLVAYSTNYMKS